MTVFRTHGGWAGHVLLCLCLYMLVTGTVGVGDLPLLCDKRFGERCISNAEQSTCSNVLAKEWSYCKEFDHFCCKDWPTDPSFVRKPDPATILMFQDDFLDNSVFVK